MVLGPTVRLVLARIEHLRGGEARDTYMRGLIGKSPPRLVPGLQIKEQLVPLRHGAFNDMWPPFPTRCLISDPNPYHPSADPSHRLSSRAEREASLSSAVS